MHLYVVYLVVFVVAMATSAPVANDAKLIGTDESVDAARGKRAQEMVYFGNQQNKPRPTTKKSDPNFKVDLPHSEQLSQSTLDVGGSIDAHPETPVTDELNARAEAAEQRGDESVKLNEAVESAMHAAIATAVGDDSQEETASNNNNNNNNNDDTDVESSEKITTTTNENEAGDNETNAVEEEEEEEDEEEEEGEGSEIVAEAGNDDDVEKELQQATATESQEVVGDEAEASTSQEGNPEESGDADARENEEEGVEHGEGTSSNGEEDQEQVQGFLAQLRKQGSGRQNGYEDPSEASPATNDYYKNTFMMPQGYQQERDTYQGYPYLPVYYRRRRSPKRSQRDQNPLSIRTSRRTQRIKRDLFKGLGLPSLDLGSDNESYQPETDDFGPLSDEEIEYVYSKLLPYLSEAYSEETAAEEAAANEVENRFYEGLADNFDSRQQYPGLGEYEPEEESVYRSEVPVYQERPYEEEEYDPSMSLDSGYRFEKRSMADYFGGPQRKRYIFPFSDEPETHWGAFVPEKREPETHWGGFVPEKRDYQEAIHRLQRLALALGEEPVDFYPEMIGEYRKK